MEVGILTPALKFSKAHNLNLRISSEVSYVLKVRYISAFKLKKKQLKFRGSVWPGSRGLTQRVSKDRILTPRILAECPNFLKIRYVSSENWYESIYSKMTIEILKLVEPLA